MKTRRKLLIRLSQANPTETTVSGSPRSIGIDSFPNQIILGWGENNAPAIQKLINILNISLFYLTNGQFDLNSLKQNNFSIDSSKYHSELKNIILFSNLTYKSILSNSGAAFKERLSAEEKKEKIDNLKTSSIFSSIPDGGINNILPTKIGGNFKSLVADILLSIK